MILTRVNPFSCMSNTIVQAGLTLNLPVAHALAERFRKVVKPSHVAAKDLRQVRVSTAPCVGHVHYTLDVVACDGRTWSDEFVEDDDIQPCDTYVLYDRYRDGIVQYLHVTH